MKAKITLFLLLATFQLVSKTPLDNATVSMYAVHMPSGEVLLDENSQKSVTPASCLKLLTTAAALHLLGPDYQFRTKLAYDGVLEEGVLKGNLYIIGGGDPCLGSDRSSSSLSYQKQIAAWILALEKMGISKIEGEILADVSSWERMQAVSSWSFEDLGNYYGAGASALSFHENAYSLVFSPGKAVGEDASILRIEPKFSHLRLHNEVKTGKPLSGDRACIYGSEFFLEQYVRGTIPLGESEFTIEGSLPNPSLACIELLENGLKEKGIVIQKDKKPSGERKIFYETLSPKLSEIVYHTNQKSINLYAEHLLKAMGKNICLEGSTEAGILAIKHFLEQKKIDIAGTVLADGSGLSRKNLVTSQFLVSVLLDMKKSPLFPLFLESLPEIRKGIRAKDGSMSLVRGYAIVINGCSDSKLIKEKINDFFSVISSLKK
jgi:D-alanyl-D-alanine carboxypeptidase/D-alanyl-D-alanine-endopeptidase (penicillin-binding protein 4)